MLKLWGRVTSVNVQKALWALGELGRPFERVDAGLQFGVVDTPAYRAMNPNAKVPVLEDDGFVLWESNAIVRYLCRTYGLGELCPADTAGQGLADQWMDWQATTLQAPMGPVFLGLIRTPEAERDRAAIERGAKATEAAVAILDGHLARNAYMLGDRFSMADIAVGAAAARWWKMPVERAPNPNVDRWLGAISERPAFREHVDIPLS